MDSAITVTGLVVDRGTRRVLDDLSFAVPAGRVTGLLGPSGSGKTTLMRALVGVQKVRSGEALAAVVIPPDFTTKLSTGGFSSAEVEVIYNGDALKQSFVRSTISSKLALADAALAKKVNQLAGTYVDIIMNGGTINVLGANFNLLGLKKAQQRGQNKATLQGRVLGLIFEKPSLRTRVSFEAAMAHLGGASIFISQTDAGLGKRESIADYARTISQFVDEATRTRLRSGERMTYACTPM